MKNIRYIDKKDVENLIESKTSDDVIIFLSGPTSQKTPLSVLQTRDVIAVNGSAQYLLSHNNYSLYLCTYRCSLFTSTA